MSRLRRRILASCFGVLAASLLPAVVRAQLTGTIAKTSDLNFGQVIAAGTGAVTLAPSGGRSAAGGVVLGSGLSASPATFVLTGPPMTAYGIILPGSLTLSSGAASATLGSFKSEPDGSGSLDASGSQTLRVGATLHTSANQQSGTYSGLFLVTVAYN